MIRPDFKLESFIWISVWWEGNDFSFIKFPSGWNIGDIAKVLFNVKIGSNGVIDLFVLSLKSCFDSNNNFTDFSYITGDFIDFMNINLGL